MAWAIRHRSRQGIETYWTGDFETSNRGIRARGWGYGTVGQARRFKTKGDAETAYRGNYRPEVSCCVAVQVRR